MIKRVLIMAGGTGGHIFPALSVAQQLQEQKIEVCWLGTHQGLEAQLIPQKSIPFYSISVSALRGKGFIRLLLAPWQLSRALYQAVRIVHRLKPDVVLGMGGFVTGPGGIAAFILRRRLVLHEQNAIPGMTNKMLSHFASVMLTGFPLKNAERNKIGLKRYVGNPVRQDIADIPEPKERLAAHQGSFRLLVFGGSLGALSFNKVLPGVLAQLPKALTLEVCHQAGKRFYKETKEIYSTIPLNVNVLPFIDDMAKAYDWADLIICRAGASTIAEISAVGIAAILVPFPYAVDDHQTANARFLSEKGAAILMPQQEFTTRNLVRKISELINDRHQILKMSMLARSLRKVDATECVVKELCYGESAK